MRKIIDTISVFSDDKHDGPGPEEEEKRNLDTSSISNNTKEITNNAVIEKDFSLRDEISQISENVSIHSEFLEISDLNKSTLTEKEETPRPEGISDFNSKVEGNIIGNNNYNKERLRSSTNLNKSYNSKKNYYKKNPRNSSRGGGAAGAGAGGGGGYKVVYEKKN
jgi:hypothetical protein